MLIKTNSSWGFLFHVNISSHDESMSLSLSRSAPPRPPHCHQHALCLCTVCPAIVQPVLLSAEYTLMLISLLAALMCSFWSMVHRDFPVATILPPSASRPPSPLVRSPTLLPCSPFGGDPGAVLKVPHTPEAVSGLLPSHERNTQ